MIFKSMSSKIIKLIRIILTYISIESSNHNVIVNFLKKYHLFSIFSALVIFSIFM